METFDTTQRQIASLAAEDHAHSVHNPLSQHQMPYTTEEVMAALASPAETGSTACAPITVGRSACGVEPIVVLQAVWLVPALDHRVASIIAGVEPPPSHLHTFCGMVEVTKVAALGLLGACARPDTTWTWPARTASEVNA